MILLCVILIMFSLIELIQVLHWNIELFYNNFYCATSERICSRRYQQYITKYNKNKSITHFEIGIFQNKMFNLGYQIY